MVDENRRNVLKFFIGSSVALSLGALTTPRYSNINPLYWLGDVAAMSFFILAITGFALALLYTPGLSLTKTPPDPLLLGHHGKEVYDATQSYSSVYKITYLTPLGFILRQIHLWAAYMMIFAMLAHFFTKFILRSYINVDRC